LAGEPKGTTVEESSLDDLFTAVPSEDKAKFQRLWAQLVHELSMAVAAIAA
jgi:hypothetical protein